MIRGGGSNQPDQTPHNKTRHTAWRKEKKKVMTKKIRYGVPVMMPSAEAPDQIMARLRGTQPELTGITKSLNIWMRSRSRLLARLVRGQITGTVMIVVTTTHQLANLSSLSWHGQVLL